MFSSKNLSDQKGLPKTIQPGNILAKINGITLEQAYDAESFNVILHLESEELGAEFEGFLIDKDNSSGARYKGQVGRVRVSPFAFTKEINGEPVNRDENILIAVKKIASLLGKGTQLDEMDAPTLESWIEGASSLICGPTLINWCIAGKEYLKDNYTKYDLFLPKPVFKNKSKGIEKTGVPYEMPGVNPSQLMEFDPAKHIIKKKAAATVTSFQPQTTYTPALQGDFEL